MIKPIKLKKDFNMTRNRASSPCIDICGGLERGGRETGEKEKNRYYFMGLKI